MSSTSVAFRVFRHLYRDSVALMQLAAALRAIPGITQASCTMATPANLEQLRVADLAIDVAADPSDLLVVVRGDPSACEHALEHARASLEAQPQSESDEGAPFRTPITSITAALDHGPRADLALISVPGDYAAAEALKALACGLDAMIFSDNVPIAEERAIKAYARSHGRLVMGPDCGTAIINGIPLGFANVVRRGAIGLVAASGTGLQEVTCRIHNLGLGVSQAIGTGGRDLHEEIGGLTMLQALEALAEDDQTCVIVLISKPPAPAVAQRVLRAASLCGKPVVVHFLGAAATLHERHVHNAQSLRHAADVAVELARGRPAPTASEIAVDRAWLDDHAGRVSPTQRYARGLFTGGTFCYEAQLLFLAQGLRCRSNTPAHGASELHETLDGNLFVDLGDDEFTRGRPHPMIDPSLRNQWVRAAGDDAGIAVLLVDLVLGYGAHPDPARDLVQALGDAQRRAHEHGRSITFIGHVCGTDGDLQDKSRQVAALRGAGVSIADSNAHAAALAAALVRQLTMA
ncbi:MAG TPA: acyl-CoA synthetase FdrA [Casimicrobiaceae bacterium]|nr:acyl-CoA synthetase FdrA [Casimicrobiaceae bacterium]